MCEEDVVCGYIVFKYMCRLLWFQLNIHLCDMCFPSGSVVGLVYLQGSSGHLPHLWNASAIVCSASTDGTVRAWNVQNVSARTSALLPV